MWTSALLKGLCELIQFPRDVTHLGIPTMTVMASHPTRNIVIGWKKLGLVIILILRRETVIKRKMMEPGMIIILENARNRVGTWPDPRHPLDLRGRARSRTPPVEKGKGKGYRVETRVYTHDDNGQRWEVVDREHDEYWDRQNEMSQFRRNTEYRRVD